MRETTAADLANDIMQLLSKLQERMAATFIVTVEQLTLAMLNDIREAIAAVEKTQMQIVECGLLPPDSEPLVTIRDVLATAKAFADAQDVVVAHYQQQLKAAESEAANG